MSNSFHFYGISAYHRKGVIEIWADNGVKDPITSAEECEYLVYLNPRQAQYFSDIIAKLIAEAEDYLLAQESFEYSSDYDWPAELHNGQEWSVESY